MKKHLLLFALTLFVLVILQSNQASALYIGHYEPCQTDQDCFEAHSPDCESYSDCYAPYCVSCDLTDGDCVQADNTEGKECLTYKPLGTECTVSQEDSCKSKTGANMAPWHDCWATGGCCTNENDNNEYQYNSAFCKVGCVPDYEEANDGTCNFCFSETNPPYACENNQYTERDCQGNKRIIDPDTALSTIAADACACAEGEYILDWVSGIKHSSGTSWVASDSLGRGPCCGDDPGEFWMSGGYMDATAGYCNSGEWVSLEDTATDYGTCDQLNPDRKCERFIGITKDKQCLFEDVTGSTNFCNSVFGCQNPPCTCDIDATGNSICISVEEATGGGTALQCEDSVCYDEYGEPTSDFSVCGCSGYEICGESSCIDVGTPGSCYQNDCFVEDPSVEPSLYLSNDDSSCCSGGAICFESSCVGSCDLLVGFGNCIGKFCCGMDGLSVNFTACSEISGSELSSGQVCDDSAAVSVSDGSCLNSQCVNNGVYTSQYDDYCCETGKCVDSSCQVCSPEGGSTGETGCYNDRLCDGSTGLLTDKDQSYCSEGICEGSLTSSCNVCGDQGDGSGTSDLGNCIGDACCDPDTGLLTDDYTKCGATIQQVCEDGTLVDRYDSPAVFEYNPDGKILHSSRIRPDGDYNIKNYQYSQSTGRLKKETVDYISSSAGSRTFDNSGPEYFTEYNAYDALGRALQISMPGGNDQMSYSFSGNTVVITDEKGNEIEYTNDRFGRVKEIREHKDGNTYTTAMEYDIRGNLVKLIDANGREINYIYDSLNNLIEMQHPDTGTTTYTYDREGDIKNATYADGRVVEYDYDKLGRISDKVSSDGLVERYYYDYCYSGKLCRVFTPEVTTHYEYDVRGRITEERKEIDGETFTTSYTYTDDDNVKTITDPEGNVIEYTYNSLSQIEDVAFNGAEVVSFSYEAGGKIDSLSSPHYTADYDYSPRSWLQKLDYGSLFTRYYSYDGIGNLDAIYSSWTTDGPEETSKLIDFGYDDLYRLVNFSYYGGYLTE